MTVPQLRVGRSADRHGGARFQRARAGRIPAPRTNAHTPYTYAGIAGFGRKKGGPMPAPGRSHGLRGGHTMLWWVLIFLVVAIIAAVFGFGGIAAGAAGIARILFFIFLVLFVIGLIMSLCTGSTPTP